MMIDRRDVLVSGASAAALGMLPWAALAQDAEAEKTMDELIAEFTGGAEVTDGEGIAIDAPEIAENGNTVPVSVEAEGASEILVLAPGNPVAAVATFKFGELAGKHIASTRIRLAQTQDVTAIAKLADGKFVRTASNVKVTIGGCGG
ncbi:thiosulfate oxidation carrier protein SoxY [Paracoccus saliphilus]|uniref:Sulfur-oxidizing protein SoxY n=1 Tax=Paracoccus saliphilus TaxID=405559 RepID=A0AA45W6M4_9RHOB|nr:thiosulfate oxidation carrier protein SoxY [Paracoccus saliphilus]WCR02890.1 thiosulfate oxidation carrier protein SoxY [Paracoccus saliphilus]SIT03306.1 sulfur-oxidizing protein SoxY [Paracoccus saliphilus]